MRGIHEIAYETEHDIIELTKMLFELRECHGEEKLMQLLKQMRDDGMEDYEIVIRLVQDHGGME